jgi:hypothetical protein
LDLTGRLTASPRSAVASRWKAAFSGSSSILPEPERASITAGGHTRRPNWPTFIAFAERYYQSPSAAAGMRYAVWRTLL